MKFKKIKCLSGGPDHLPYRGVTPADRCVLPVSALQLDDVKRSRQTEDQSRTHPEVLEGIQVQLVSPPIEHRERCQELKHLHLHHDVGRVQS